MDGYVLLSLKPGMKKKFMNKVQDVKEVKEAWLTIGIYDAIVKIQSTSIDELERIYFNKIDKIEGIAHSRLHFVACPRTRK
jgi:DNA-binding Lrp family transcriptional regulator